MPSARFSRTVVKQGTSRGRAGAKVAYIHREGQHSPAVERIEYLGETKAHAVRDDLVTGGTHNLPAWAASAAEYFSAAERFERAQGVIMVEWKFDLPTKADRATQLAITHAVMQAHLGANHVYKPRQHILYVYGQLDLLYLLF